MVIMVSSRFKMCAKWAFRKRTECSESLNVIFPSLSLAVNTRFIRVTKTRLHVRLAVSTQRLYLPMEELNRKSLCTSAPRPQHSNYISTSCPLL